MKEKNYKIIKNVLKEAITSIFLYKKGKNHIHVFILNRINFNKLDSLKKDFKGQNFIVLKKEKDLIEGTDVFALELLYMSKHYEKIEGEDYFQKMNFKKENIRSNLEFELRNKLVYLREQFILSKKPGTFLGFIIPNFDYFLEGLFFLKDKKRTDNILDDAKMMEKEYGVSLKTFRHLAEKENNKEKLSKDETIKIVQGINDELVALTEKINRM